MAIEIERHRDFMDDSVKTFWDQQAGLPPDTNWMANPLIRQYINESVSGDPTVWPISWFEKTYPRRFKRALCIGCGTGALERGMAVRGAVDRVDAFDGSAASLAIARAEAEREGVADRIDYFEEDFNHVVLPKKKYDLVLFHQSLHHVSRMERLLSQVMNTLTDDGMLYLDEYVGPSRTFWNDRTVAVYRALYFLLPPEIRYFAQVGTPIQYDDHSEAARSGEIESRLRVGFRIEHFRGYGGNIAAMMFPNVHVPFLTEEIVRLMITIEKSLLASGVPPFCAVIVARPKTRRRALSAKARYFLEPKVRRVEREVRKLFGMSYRYAAREEDRFRM